MISFLLLVMVFLIPCIYYFVTDIIKYNKISYKMLIAVVLLIIAIYIKSIGY
jgi:uncharacterized membrane protein